MRLTFTILFFLCTILLKGQNDYLSLGFDDNGICIGNSAFYNGLRLNFVDTDVDEINGVSIAARTHAKFTNGLIIGILAVDDGISNGVQISGLLAGGTKHNGLTLSCFFLGARKFNGFGVAGILGAADTLNGFLCAGAYIGHYSDSETMLINGIAIAGGGIRAVKIKGFALSLIKNTFKKQNGVSISAINEADELHGVQFGLINHAKNNRKIFRWTPFFNFNFRKK